MKLQVTPKGKKFLYEIINDNGEVIAKRTSNRSNYVAATMHGHYFFGRIDLIGKGDHGRSIANYERTLATANVSQAGIIEGAQYAKMTPEQYLQYSKDMIAKDLQTLKTIAYL